MPPSPASLNAGPRPSYSWFEAAAAEEGEPPYRVEPSRSGRSRCTARACAAVAAAGVGSDRRALVAYGTDATIGMGELRCGALDREAGAYGRWRHLRCWRVPAKVRVLSFLLLHSSSFFLFLIIISLIIIFILFLVYLLFFYFPVLPWLH